MTKALQVLVVVFFNSLQEKPIKLVLSVFLSDYFLSDTFSFVIKEINHHLKTQVPEYNMCFYFGLCSSCAYLNMYSRPLNNGFELHGSTCSQIFSVIRSWPSTSPGFPSADAEGPLHKGFEYPRSLVTSGVLEPTPRGCQGMTLVKFLESQNYFMDFQLHMRSAPQPPWSRSTVLASTVNIQFLNLRGVVLVFFLMFFIFL